VPDSIVDADSMWSAPAAGRPREDGSPALTLDGFAGPLDHLLALARAQKIDLAALPFTALLDQLTAALQQAPASMPLVRRATGW
jgi:segregation and condensation protein A